MGDRELSYNSRVRIGTGDRVLLWLIIGLVLISGGCMLFTLIRHALWGLPAFIGTVAMSLAFYRALRLNR